MAQRIAYLDIVGGLCILHICISHIVQDLGLEANIWGVLHVVFWSMAWFFFKAGMFHGKKSFKETVKKSYSRLIVPFIAFSILGECVNIFAVLKSHPIVFSDFVKDTLIRLIQRGFFEGNPPLWFLLSLFCNKVYMLSI